VQWKVPHTIRSVYRYEDAIFGYLKALKTGLRSIFSWGNSGKLRTPQLRTRM